MNETNQGQTAALLIFISVLLVLGSLLTAFAESGFPVTGTGNFETNIQATDYVFASPTPISSPTFTQIPPSPTSPIPTSTPVSNPTETDPAPMATRDTACSIPPGWISYTVQAGDTLFQISQAFNLSISELQDGNCMGDFTSIISGSVIWVPDIATLTAAP